jgi:Holliday junction resolvase YEN1
MTVLMSSRDINTKDGAQIYFAHTIQHVDGVTLSRGGLFLIALLAGGDYDKGVPGCRMGIAHGLAQCGFGVSLLDAALKHSSDPTKFHLFLPEWLKTVREELVSNSQGYLGCRQERLSSCFTLDTFLGTDIVQHYANPVTLWLLQPGLAPTNFTDLWISQEPVIHKIAKFCMEHFRWTSPELLKMFYNILWEGM